MSHAQLGKAAQLWAQWRSTHELSTQALSSAVNIHRRVEVVADPAAYPDGVLLQQPNIQELVLGKQLASFNRALQLVRSHHDVLQELVRDMERVAIEATRGLGTAGALDVLAAPTGPQPTLVQLVEAVQDMWAMCRDELLLKVAVVGLVGLDTPAEDMAALLQCYTDQPNIEAGRVDAVLEAYHETKPQTEAR